MGGEGERVGGGRWAQGKGEGAASREGGVLGQAGQYLLELEGGKGLRVHWQGSAREWSCRRAEPERRVTQGDMLSALDTPSRILA